VLARRVLRPAEASCAQELPLRTVGHSMMTPSMYPSAELSRTHTATGAAESTDGERSSDGA
jgi:hypothetical protein